MNITLSQPKNINNSILFITKRCVFIFLLIISATAFSQDISALKNTVVVSYLNANFPHKIRNVIVDKNTVTIQGIISGSAANLYLCELRMFDETKMVSNSFASVTPITTSNANFEIQLKRLGTANNNQPYDRIYSRWLIASKNGGNYQAQSYAHYAEDITDAALQYLPEEKPLNKKGLEGFFQESRESDLTDLGLGNVTVNITLPQVISLEPTNYSYKLDGKTFYMNPATVEHYDREFKLCSDENVFVTAIILIQQNIPQNVKSILVHPNANAGVESMANITSQQGFEYYAALIGFLGERYNRPDKQYGRIQNWIVHNEVDNGVYWTNAGTLKMESYTELYDRVMRTTYYAVRQYNPAAKVFISLTHAWATADQRFYPPKQMLALFNEMSKKQGDYEWGVAFHPYPEDIFNPTTWNDKDATMDLNTTKVITPKNIELIDAWMRTRLHLYKGQKVRTLLFSEQGAHSKSYSPQDMLAQAAVVAYMWKKCSRLPSVESFDYHAQCDNRNEHGLKFGLWTVKGGTIATPAQKKTSWQVYQKAGTPSEDSAFAFSLPVIGIKNWQQAYNKLSNEVMPYTITFNITRNGNPVKDVSVYFNSEMHKTINGTAVFYNVASVEKNRNARIIKNGEILSRERNVIIDKDQTISIDVAQ